MTGKHDFLRQVHPTHLEDDGRIQSVAFWPFPRDDGKLSTFDGTKLSPKDAYEQHCHGELSSAGTWEIKEAEATQNGLGILRDGGIGDNPDHHVSLDFNTLNTDSKNATKRRYRQVGTRLRDEAQARGRLYPTQDEN